MGSSAHEMTPERWARIEGVLDEILGVEPGERAAKLDALCEGDVDLRRDVERLLAAETHRQGILDESPLDVLAELLRTDLGEGFVGRRVGPYRITGELGRGGMGIVFEAEREDLGKRVALKIAREALLSPDRVSRFQIEQRVLARLQHPHIAQLHDAGVTPEGSPYFAMEIVDGETIVQHFERNDAGLTARLEAFLDVCSAVQFAHRNLVIHRDIKPSNVCVTREGEVKLLDFGVAKLLEDEDAPLTGTGGRVYTPGYAAPEQLEGRPVTTSTDVYQLGGLLYSLLSGRPPFPVGGLSPFAAERLVLETDPDPPSVARGSDRTGEKPAARFSIPRDLDAIVLNALEKEPERRYPSVEALADDLRRCLASEPVEARGGGWSYRARRFVRRHRVGSGVAALVAASLVVALVQARAVASQRDRAEREAETARRVADFMVGLFENATPGEDGVDALELVDAGAERVGRELEGQPVIRASFQEALGRVYHALGRYEEAEPLLLASLDTRRELFGPEAPETASSQHYLARVVYATSDYDRADSLGREALALRMRAFGGESGEVMESLRDLAAVAYQAGTYEEAEDLGRRAVAIGRGLYPEGDASIASALNTLANAVWAQGRRAEGRELMWEAARAHRAAVGGDDPALAITLNNVAFMTHFTGGSLDSARAAAQDALGMQERLFPEGHPDISWTRDNLAEITLLQGDTAGAERLFRESMDMRLRLLGPDHSDMIESYEQLARVTALTARYEEAERNYREAIRVTGTVFGPAHPLAAQFRFRLGETYSLAGRAEEARRLFETAYRAGQESLGTEHATVISWGRRLAQELRGAGNETAALEVEAELPPDTATASPGR